LILISSQAFVGLAGEKQMRMAVRSVAKHFPTAIVSGRCRDKVPTTQHPPNLEETYISSVTHRLTIYRRRGGGGD
jgi:hypothetical protein